MDDSGEFERLLAEIRSIRESKIIHEKGLEAFVGFTTESDFLDLKADARAWSSLFEQHFLHSDIGDDLLFYVKIGGDSNELLVHRKHSEVPPHPQIESTAINWEETVYLNFVLQRFSYRLTLDVCEREATVSGRKVAPKVAAAPPLTQTLYHADHAIFCSPSRRSMSDKGHADAMTYPDLYFTLDCFDDVFAAIEVPPESIFRLEMVAVASKVSHGALHATYARRDTGVRVGERAFLDVDRPNGEGRAQVAVAAVAAPRPRGLARSLSVGARSLAALVGYGGAPPPRPLNACVTFVCMPAAALLAQLLQRPRRPVLTRTLAAFAPARSLPASASASTPAVDSSGPTPLPAPLSATHHTSLPSQSIPEDASVSASAIPPLASAPILVSSPAPSTSGIPRAHPFLASSAPVPFVRVSPASSPLLRAATPPRQSPPRSAELSSPSRPPPAYPGQSVARLVHVAPAMSRPGP